MAALIAHPQDRFEEGRMRTLMNAVCNDRTGNEKQARHAGKQIRTGAWIAILISAVCPGQNTQINRPAGYWPDKDTSVTPVNQRPDANAQMQRSMKRAQTQRFEAVNAERKRQLEEEAELLLQLAAEVDSELSKTGPDALPPAVIEKIETIEKLAHTVKEKMKLTVTAS